MGVLVCSTMSTMKQIAVLLLCATVFASASPMVQYHQSRRAGSGSGSGSGSLAPTLAPSLAPTSLAPSAAPTKYPTGAPVNTPTNTPTIGYTAAATQVTQTIVQTVPGVDSAATFNAEPTVKDAYEKGYGSVIGITDTDTKGSVTYKTGCSVDAYAADARRAAMSVQYSSFVSEVSGVDTTVASAGITDATALVTAVNTVIASDTTTYASVTVVTASDITSVGTAESITVEGGTVAPTSAPNNDSDLDLYLIIVAVVGGVILLGLIIMVAVNVASKPSKEETFRAESAAAEAGVGVPLQEPVPKAQDDSQL